jgi:hypothetical protein
MTHNRTSQNTAAALVRYAKRPWYDLLSIYYTNTPIWRWLKSAALVFLGFFLWAAGNVLLSVQPAWTFLSYVIAYGFVVVAWGPFTHMAVVPLTIRLRRTAQHPVTQRVARQASKLNFAVFLLIVVVVGTLSPGVMLLEFSPSFGDDGGADVSGELVCDTEGEVVACSVENAQGIDHVTASANGETIATAEEPPFAFEVERDRLEETRTGREFTVDYRNAEGQSIQRYIERVPEQ